MVIAFASWLGMYGYMLQAGDMQAYMVSPPIQRVTTAGGCAVGPSGPGQSTAAADASSGNNAGVSMLELHQMMLTLTRMEEREKQMR